MCSSSEYLSGSQIISASIPHHEDTPTGLADVQILNYSLCMDHICLNILLKPVSLMWLRSVKWNYQLTALEAKINNDKSFICLHI